MRYGKDYYQACALQQMLQTTIEQGVEQKSLGQIIRAWIELVAFKRELRGIPRLKASELLALMPKATRAAAGIADVPMEIITEPTSDKESLKHSFSETVTAPPTGTPPSAGE